MRHARGCEIRRDERSFPHFRTYVHRGIYIYMFSQTYLHINTRIGRCPRSRYVGALFRWGIRHRSCSRHEIKAIDRRCTGCTLQDTRTGTNWWAIDDLSANLDANWFHFVNERSVLRNMHFFTSLSQASYSLFKSSSKIYCWLFHVTFEMIFSGQNIWWNSNIDLNISLLFIINYIITYHEYY